MTSKQAQYDMLVAAQDISLFNLMTAIKALEEVKRLLPELGYELSEMDFILGYLKRKKELVKDIDVSELIQGSLFHGGY